LNFSQEINTRNWLHAGHLERSLAPPIKIGHFRGVIQTPFTGSGTPSQVDGALLHAISDSELSRLRTEL
jgi:hypothetical protein